MSGERDRRPSWRVVRGDALEVLAAASGRAPASRGRRVVRWVVDSPVACVVDSPVAARPGEPPPIADRNGDRALPPSPTSLCDPEFGT
jgi:hypothetical protein